MEASALDLSAQFGTALMHRILVAVLQRKRCCGNVTSNPPPGGAAWNICVSAHSSSTRCSKTSNAPTTSNSHYRGNASRKLLIAVKSSRAVIIHCASLNFFPPPREWRKPVGSSSESAYAPSTPQLLQDRKVAPRKKWQ